MHPAGAAGHEGSTRMSDRSSLTLTYGSIAEVALPHSTYPVAVTDSRLVRCRFVTAGPASDLSFNLSKPKSTAFHLDHIRLPEALWHFVITSCTGTEERIARRAATMRGKDHAG